MPDRLYIARLTEQNVPFGPFTVQRTAEEFAAYLTTEVDPAEVLWLRDPVAELLNWRAQHLSNYGQSPEVDLRAGHAPGCRVSNPHFYPTQCLP